MRRLLIEYMMSKENNETTQMKHKESFLRKSLRSIILPIFKNNASVNTNEEENKSIDYKELYENTEKRLNEVTAKLKKANNQLHQEKDKNIKLKNNNFSYIEAAKSLKDDNDNLQKEIKDLNIERENLERNLNAKINELSELHTFKANFNKLIASNSDLRSKNEGLNQKIKALKAKLENQDLLKNTELDTIQSLKISLRNVNAELLAFKDKCGKLENNIYNLSTSNLIDMLSKHLSLDTVIEYSALKQLFNRYSYLLSKYNNIVLLKNKDGDLEKEDNICYGFLIGNEEDMFFNSIDGKIYNVINSYKRIEFDCPTKASIENGEAIILDTYDIEEEVLELEQSKTKIDNKAIKNTPKELKNNDVIFPKDCFNGLKVLIVGSRNKEIYKAQLSNCGAEVMCFDPFEESAVVLKNRYEKADIVVLCASHIGHYVETIVDVNNPKVTSIHNDNKNSMLIRVRFMAINLGFIRIGNT